MKHATALETAVGELLAEQRLAVLASVSQGQPHTSLVAFVSSPDLKSIFFATARSSYPKRVGRALVGRLPPRA